MTRRLRRVWARLRGALTRSQGDREFQEELASHLAMHVEDNLRAGQTPEKARRQALLALGGVDQARELYHDQKGLPFLEVLAQDLRMGARMLAKTPLFTGVALLVLALGIGANTVMFSVANTLLLRSLPYPDARRLLHVQSLDRQGDEGATAVPDFEELRARNRTFQALASYYVSPLDLTGVGEPERVRALVVSSEFLRVLRTPPAVGRDLASRDERWGDHRVVLLTDALWRQRFGGDASWLGRPVLLSGQPYTIVGVLPPGFAFQGIDAQALVPMSFAPGDNLNSHNNYFLTMVGRLREDVAARAALGDLNGIAQAIAERHPESQGLTFGVKPLGEALVGDVRPAVLVLCGAVAFVLLIACANLAGLMLARAADRRREIALRVAIGASRLRVLRQLLTESLLLALAGSALALGLAWGALRAVQALGSDLLPRSADVHIDAAVLAFTCAIAVLTGILFGTAPALRGTDVQPADVLKAGSRTTGDRQGHRIRSLLVVGEVAFSLVLLIGAGLMMRSLHGLTRLDAGFDPERVLTAQVSVPRQRYVDVELERRFSPLAYTRASRFFDDVVREARAVPGVAAVGAINGLPLMGEIWGKTVTLHDRPLPASMDELPLIQYRVVAGEYFRAMGVPIVAGRAFDDADTQEAAKVAIVNAAMARRHWPSVDAAIGKAIAVNPPMHLLPPGAVPPDYEPTLFTIVGVAADVRYGALQAPPRALVYTPFSQGSEGETTLFLVVRADSDPAALAGTIRDRVRQVDADVPTSNVQTMDARVAASLARPRLNTILLGAFAVMALVLAATGIYGVIAHAAHQRTQEIGIRMAIGASPSAIGTLFLRQGLRLVGAGVLAGLLGAAALTRTLQPLLVGVPATDAVVFGAITALLSVIGIAAAWLPARRAARLDPLLALRTE